MPATGSSSGSPFAHTTCAIAVRLWYRCEGTQTPAAVVSRRVCDQGNVYAPLAEHLLDTVETRAELLVRDAVRFHRLGERLDVIDMGLDHGLDVARSRRLGSP